MSAAAPCKKEELLAGMARHVLAEGLNTASLRPLARAAGTSDRMLIYHFGSKAGLVDALLAHLAQEMVVLLGAAAPPHHFESRAACLSGLVAMMRAPELAGFVRVWLDVVSAAAQGSESHAQAGQAVVGGFIDWVATRLPVDDADPLGTAEAMLPLVEGVLVMDAVGHSAAADRAVAAMVGGGL